MNISDRTKRIMELNKKEIIRDWPNSSFWKERKKSNWFCNRQLSPPQTLSELGQSGQDNYEEKTSVLEGEKTQDNIKNRNYIDPNKKIIVHQVIITPGNRNSVEFENNAEVTSPFRNETQQLKSLDEIDEFNTICPPTPDEPFDASDSDSLYCPSDEDDMRTLQTSSRLTRRSKLKTNLSGKNYIEIPARVTTNEIPEDLPDISSDELSVVESSAVIKSHRKVSIYKRKPDYCYFCETQVQNFGRHVIRNHNSESSVAEILSKPVKSKERRELLNKLRRKGNYLGSERGHIKAVRQTSVQNRNLLPCDSCLGFFSSKLLYRHRNKCNKNKINRNAQAAGQNQMIHNLRVDVRLKNEVFPHMRADIISLEAKNDKLICAFGARYLNTHREKHFIQVTSRKMRELAKILLELRKLEPTITSMLSALHPKNFDLFVEATKRISCYNTNTLVDSIYCRVILLNRKRCGELQRMLLHTYLNNTLDKEEYEEFQTVVSSTEQVLLKYFKRVVIRGKRGRGVPVLFSGDVQNHIKILLTFRQYFVPTENPYLFAKANSVKHLIGYKTLSKYAKCCGAKNPSAITSTRLRKHLATLSQLFTLSENEIEQLATFMGHTPGVHKKSYRLPDDVYQTAKISKLLLIMEKGTANQFMGKSLDEIDIDLEQDLMIAESDQSESELIEENSILLGPNRQSESHREQAVKSAEKQLKDITISDSSVSRKPRKLVRWTTKQKEVTKNFFKDHLKNSRPPKRHECEKLKAQFPDLLGNKDWLKIKVFIQNEYKKSNI